MKFVLFLASFLCSLLSYSQVSLQLSPTNHLNFSSKSVWDCSVTNNSESSFTAKFNATISDKSLGRVVYAESVPVTINPGVNVFNSMVIGVSKLTYSSSEVENYEVTSGTLPPGEYIYCLELICVDQTCARIVGFEKTIKACETIQKESQTPLLLASPKDEVKIKQTRPDFTWIPPMPIGSDPNITYSFKLVELESSQSPEDGVKRNRPLYSTKGIQGTMLTFPSELDDLKKEHRYGWQVEAWLGQKFIAISDAWEFEIDKEIEKLNPMPFVRLTLQDHSTYSAINELRFIYEEPTRKGILDIHFYNSSGTEIKLPNVAFATTYGDNKFSLDLKSLGLEPGQEYRMDIRSPQGVTYSLKFRYIFQFK